MVERNDLAINRSELLSLIKDELLARSPYLDFPLNTNINPFMNLALSRQP